MLAREVEEKPKMGAAQITGSCSSYARKYALNGLVLYQMMQKIRIIQQSGLNGRESLKDGISKAEIAKLQQEAARTGTNLSTVCQRCKVAVSPEYEP